MHCRAWHIDIEIAHTSIPTIHQLKKTRGRKQFLARVDFDVLSIIQILLHSLLVINSNCISSKLVKYHRIFFFSFHLSPEILCVPIYQKQVLLYIQSLFPEFNVSWRVQDVKLRGLLVMLSNIIAWRLFYKNSINIISKNQSYNLFRNVSFWYMKLNWLT